jgi:hypothetical protein
MTRSNDGGPAFPTDVGDYTTGATRSILQPGMTLRDYFTAAVVSGIYANPGLSAGIFEQCKNDPKQSSAVIATMAKIQAEAILKARLSGNQSE